MSSNDWIVVVIKLTSDKARDMLVDFYRYAEDLIGVKDVHFVIRDRVDEEVVFSFRILVESQEQMKLEERVAFKLGGKLPDDALSLIHI